MKKITFIIFLSCIANNLCFSISNNEDAINTRLDSVRELLVAGRYGDSVRKKLNPILKEVLAKNDSVLIRRVYNEIGISFAQEENYNEGLNYFYKSLDYCINPEQRAAAFNNIAIVHRKNGNDEKSLEMNKKGIELLERGNDSINLAKAYLIRAILESNKQNYEEVNIYLKKALGIVQKKEIKYLEYNCYNNLGANEFEKGNFKASLDLFKKAIICAKNVGNMNGFMFSNANLAGVYAKLNQKDSALKYIQYSIDLSNEYTMYLETNMGVFDLASDINQKYGNLSEALFYHEKYEKLRDSLKLKNHISDYLSIELGNNLNDEGNEEESYSKRIVYLSVIFSVIFGFFLFRYFKRKPVLKEGYIETEIKTSLSTLNLTKREKEIALLILKGLSSPDIAEKLFISVNTVNSHRKKIYKKTNVSSLSEFILSYEA